MKVLVINAGSSSLKYQLLEVESKKVLAKGICERIGTPQSFHKHGLDKSTIDNIELNDHTDAMKAVVDTLLAGPDSAISSLDEIEAVGHRTVQGGTEFSKSCLITKDVIDKIIEYAELAPLHNKASLMGIEACQKLMPSVPMVGVFDTGYFNKLPKVAATYPLPYDLCKKYSIRRYGMHGTSHRYLTERAAVMLNKDIKDTSVITCHLGNGASITASRAGRALDTSMGLTPLDGIMMGTRCGCIDPAIVTFVMEHEGIDTTKMSDIMNKESGLLGVSGVSNDMRSVNEAAESGNERARLALDVYYYTIRKFIGQYYAVLNGDVDAIVMSAGIGENDNVCRENVFKKLDGLGFKLDFEKNKIRSDEEREISTQDSKIKIFVIPTQEEYMIARDTYEIVTGKKL